jgi:hypothetical protein
MEQAQHNQEAVAHRGGGAKTEEGKALVSKNAIRHGLLSREVLLKSEDAKTLDELRHSITTELAPHGEMEAFLVDRLVADMWRMRRALVVERHCGEAAKEKVKGELFGDSIYGSKEGLAQSIEAAPFTDYRSDKVLRYLTTIERSFFRTFHELQRIQAARNGENVPAPTIVDVNMDGQAPLGE